MSEINAKPLVNDNSVYLQLVVLISIDFGGTTNVGWPDFGRQTNTWAELAV